jgi:aminopeptidase N
VWKEKSYFAEAEALRVLGAQRHKKVAHHIQEALKKNSWNEVTRSAALDAMALTRDAKWIPAILKYTKEGVPHRLRMAALRAILVFRPATEDTKKRLEELLQDKFLLVQIAAVRALQELGDERQVPALKKLMVGDWDGRLKRLAEEAVNKLTKGFES